VYLRAQAMAVVVFERHRWRRGGLRERWGELGCRSDRVWRG
jgi:hypothetical protein